MTHPVATGLLVVAGLLSVVPYQAYANAQAESLPVTLQAVSSDRQWATFDFTGLNDSGNLQFGQPFELSITLGGMPPDTFPMVAICESAQFESRIVPLQPDPGSPLMKATTTLTPIAQDRPSFGPHVSRLHVTFARSTEKKFERVMTRIVYFTMGYPKRADDEPVSLTTHQDKPSEIDLAANQAEPLPDAIPLLSDEVVEEDLLPSRSVQPTPAYWNQVRDLLNRSWSRITGHMPVSVSSQSVQVQFRLYPSGHTQLLQIADGSGASEIDQAGIQTIAEAQPFPRFPTSVGNEPVEIHVRLQTGSKAGVRDIHTGTPRQLGRTISQPNN